MSQLEIPISDWCGYVRASCPICKKHHQVADTEAQAKALIRKHMYVRHVAALGEEREQAARIAATLYDANGKLIERMPLPDDAAFADLKSQLQEND